jgi:site-specific recombinase XerD
MNGRRGTQSRSVPLESAIQASICDYLAARRHFFFRSNNVSVFEPRRLPGLPKHTPRGLADIIVVCTPGAPNSSR